MKRIYIFVTMLFFTLYIIPAQDFNQINTFDLDIFKEQYIAIKEKGIREKITYDVTDNKEILTITRTKGKEKKILKCKTNLDFLTSYTFQDDKLIMQINRIDSTLTMFYYKQNGEVVKKSVSVNNNTILYSGIVMPVLFSYYPFNNNKTITFFIVNENVDFFGVSEMQITNEGIQSIEIDNKIYATYRLRFSPTGLGALFYQAYFWFTVSQPHYLIKQDMQRGEVIILNVY